MACGASSNRAGLPHGLVVWVGLLGVAGCTTERERCEQLVLAINEGVSDIEKMGPRLQTTEAADQAKAFRDIAARYAALATTVAGLKIGEGELGTLAKQYAKMAEDHEALGLELALAAERNDDQTYGVLQRERRVPLSAEQDRVVAQIAGHCKER